MYFFEGNSAWQSYEFIALRSRVISGSHLKMYFRDYLWKIYIKAASHNVLLGAMGNKFYDSHPVHQRRPSRSRASSACLLSE